MPSKEDRMYWSPVVGWLLVLFSGPWGLRLGMETPEGLAYFFLVWLPLVAAIGPTVAQGALFAMAEARAKERIQKDKEMVEGIAEVINEVNNSRKF